MGKDALIFLTTALFTGLYLGAIGLYAWEIHLKGANRTAAIAAVLYWLVVHPTFLWISETQFDSYAKSAPLVVTALNLPSILSVILLATWKPFQIFVDKLSLTFLIETVEAIPRILVGSMFLAWWWKGRLPVYFAWVAGPGDILSGIFALLATRWALAPLYASSPMSSSPSAQELIDTLSIRRDKGDLSETEAKAYLKQVNWAIGLVLVGILDFVAAPASSLFSIAMGQIPDAMGKVPLGMVPTCLVPTAYTLEVWAMFQLLKLRRCLKAYEPKSE